MIKLQFCKSARANFLLTPACGCFGVSRTCTCTVTGSDNLRRWLSPGSLYNRVEAGKGGKAVKSFPPLPGTLSQEGAYLYLFGLGEKLRNLSASDNLLDSLCSILNVTGSKHSTKSQLTVDKSILFLQPKISTGLHLSRWQASYRPAGVSLISRSGAVTVFPDKR